MKPVKLSFAVALVLAAMPLVSFAQEAEQFSLDWVIVFAASLSGRNGTPPSAADAEEPIKRMVATIKAGDVRSLLPFNRQGEPVQLG